MLKRFYNVYKQCAKKLPQTSILTPFFLRDRVIAMFGFITSVEVLFIWSTYPYTCFSPYTEDIISLSFLKHLLLWNDYIQQKILIFIHLQYFNQLLIYIRDTINDLYPNFFTSRLIISNDQWTVGTKKL